MQHWPPVWLVVWAIPCFRDLFQAQLPEFHQLPLVHWLLQVFEQHLRWPVWVALKTHDLWHIGPCLQVLCYYIVVQHCVGAYGDASGSGGGFYGATYPVQPTTFHEYLRLHEEVSCHQPFPLPFLDCCAYGCQDLPACAIQANTYPHEH